MAQRSSKPFSILASKTTDAYVSASMVNASEATPVMATATNTQAKPRVAKQI